MRQATEIKQETSQINSSVTVMLHGRLGELSGLEPFFGFENVQSASHRGASLTEASAVTDDNGRFELGGSATASIVVDPSQDPMGRTAVDTDTISSDNPNGDAFTGILLAPAGSSVVTPLTTLVQQMVIANPTLSSDDAQSAVKQALGITGDADLLSVDPIASSNLEVYKAGVQVAGLIAVAGGGAAGLEVTKALSQAVKTASDSSSSIDLTNADAVKAVERQPSWPVPTTTLAGGAERKTGMPVWRAVPPT